MDNKLRGPLESGIEKLGLSITSQQTQQLLGYLGILEKWNKAYNLTAVLDPTQMLTTHLIDSLSIVSLIKGERILDVGTGAGLPGVPLAILYPNRHFTLLDSNGKKIRFLFQVKSHLGLTNITEVQHRAENYLPKELFDSIITRAFSSLADMTKKTTHLLVEGGRFYAMKGQHPDQELSMLSKHYKVIASHELLVPGMDSKRHLVEIELSHPPLRKTL